MTTDLFTFTHDTGVYTFERPITDVLTPKFLRANRRRDEMDLVFTILEEVAGDAVLEVVDSMSAKEFGDFSKGLQKGLQDAMGATLGE